MKKKKSFTNIIMIIICLILVVYIVYSRMNASSLERSQNIDAASKNDAENETETGTNSELIVKLSNYLSGHSKLNGSYDDSWIYKEDFYNYSTKKVTVSNLSSDNILTKAFWYLYRYERMDIININKTYLENAITTLYGSKVTYKHQTFTFDQYTCTYTDDYICENNGNKHNLLEKENYKITKATQYNTGISIYEYFYYPEYVDGKYLIYNTFDKAKLIATLTEEEYKNTDIFTEYKSSLNLYKHIYKFTGTDNYYWYSTEIVEIQE